MQNIPERYVALRPEHVQVPFEWQGRTIRVDDGLVPLLKALNALDGVASISSCIDNDGKGYALIIGDTNEQLYAAVTRIALVVLPLNAKLEYTKDGEDRLRAALSWKVTELEAVTKAVERC